MSYFDWPITTKKKKVEILEAPPKYKMLLKVGVPPPSAHLER
jgi:hypothetical protein